MSHLSRIIAAMHPSSFRELGDFLSGIGRHWRLFVTGAFLSLAAGLWEHYYGTSIRFGWYVALLFLGLPIASYLVWRDERRVRRLAEAELAIIDGRFYFDNQTPGADKGIIIAITTTSPERRAWALSIKKSLETSGSVVYGIEEDLAGLEPKEQKGIWVFSQPHLADILRQVGVVVQESQQHWGRPAVVIGD
jgi:hypothetical protein